MIFINFKTYQVASGENTISLVRILEDVARETQIKIIPVVQVIDLKSIVKTSKLEVWVQNVDTDDYGAHTGSVLAEEVFRSEAKGTFLNHSEIKFKDFSDLSLANKKALEVGLKTLIFASDIEEIKKVVDLKPTFIAYEPPELIGSTKTSVSEAKPEIISQASEITREKGIPLIVGAGVHSGKDVRKSIELGAVGVALATDVVKAQDPKKELLDLTKGFEG